MQGAIDPEVRLAIAYAPAPTRSGLTALWRLDARLGAIASAARDPMIAAIKLAWWREALAGEQPAKGEPLLDELAALRIDTAALAPLADGWAEIDDASEHARLRGGTLFKVAARLLGAEAPFVVEAGQGWALAQRDADAARPMLAEALAARWPVALRPLGMLAKLAAREPGERAGSPARMLAMLRFRLTGR